jgi:urocanate hydratase
MTWQDEILEGIPNQIPPMPPEVFGTSRAPARRLVLNKRDQSLALENALRYFPEHMHAVLAPEFLEELRTLGRIYMHRFRPKHPIVARPESEYPAKVPAARGIMHMIQNNLDPRVAQFPYELVTYGNNGSVFQNWAQYRLTMKYLATMEEDQTLVMKSGHPDGVYPSFVDSPLVTITNGLVVPRFGSLDDQERLTQLLVTMYGQMTAGSWMYIGPQGIVHGTALTLKSAGRLYLKLGPEENLKGKLFVTSGLGGMSGAQGRAAVIEGAVAVIAEVKLAALKKRRDQKWLDEIHADLPNLMERIRVAVETDEAVSLGYHGNVVDLWEALLNAGIKVDLGSDQTSLHDPFKGGYYPAGMSVASADSLIASPLELAESQLRDSIFASLRRQTELINAHVERGMFFWDYGNRFLDMAREAGAEILNEDGSFRYPSYVEDIMGPVYFDNGFGPFRWVCLSGLESDLLETDKIAAEVLEEMLAEAPSEIRQQLIDNLSWIRGAADNKLDVGSKARILYSNAEGRMRLALAINAAVRSGRLKGPVIIGRDHHDPSGTDAFLRETSDIKDGSAPTADMSTQTFLGNAIRGATWVSLHNGGGTGWGNANNGGFGLYLDGSDEADRTIVSMITWDVVSGVSRRAWAGSINANATIRRELARIPELQVTLRSEVDRLALEKLVG